MPADGPRACHVQPTFDRPFEPGAALSRFPATPGFDSLAIRQPERVTDRTQQGFLAERLRKEFNGSCFECVTPGLLIRVGRDDIVGIRIFWSARWRCSSKPVIVGMCMSRSRHFVSSICGEPRKSSAEENTSERNPFDFSRLVVASRTDWSSSTIEISEMRWLGFSFTRHLHGNRARCHYTLV